MSTRFKCPCFTNVHKVALLTFFSSLYLYGHVGTIYLQARHLSLLQASSIGSIIVITIFLAELPTGILADRIGRKKSIVMALFLQFLGELLYLFASSYLAFVGIAILAGIGFAFSSGCVEALIYDSLPKDNREDRMKQAMGLNGAAYYLAFFIAPIIGTLLVPQFTIERFLLTVFITACSVLVALLIAFSLEETVGERGETETAVSILKNGIQTVRGNRFLLWLVGVSIFTSTFAGTLSSLFQPYFADFGLTARSMGIASAMGALLAVGLQKNIFRFEQQVGKRTAFTMSTLLPGIGYMLLAFAPSSGVAFAAFLFTYGTATVKGPLLSSYQNGVIPEKVRATVLSFINLLVSFYAAAVGLLMGWLADRQVTWPFLLAGVLILLFAGILRVDRIMLRQDSQPLI
ncbi:MFS transporter [Candidatus Leptofilum sp.]|uniref:MFS transporter n=1 Tax=Candidatus Leptofilum sp. TaxID=3241576 RepID=UPI003B590294